MFALAVAALITTAGGTPPPPPPLSAMKAMPKAATQAPPGQTPDTVRCASAEIAIPYYELTRQVVDIGANTLSDQLLVDLGNENGSLDAPETRLAWHADYSNRAGVVVKSLDGSVPLPAIASGGAASTTIDMTVPLGVVLDDSGAIYADINGYITWDADNIVVECDEANTDKFHFHLESGSLKLTTVGPDRPGWSPKKPKPGGG